MFKKIWLKIKTPSNQNVQFMEVKEQSERVEIAKVQAREAYGIFMHEQKVYQAACDQYAAQFKKKKW